MEKCIKILFVLFFITLQCFAAEQNSQVYAGKSPGFEIKIKKLTTQFNSINLTEKEKLYIKKHPVIRAQNEKNWPPFNFNINGKAKGFSVDYMNLLARKLHVKVKYISGYSWNGFMRLLQTPKLDVIINIAKNKTREKRIDFTDSYYTTYSAIYVNINKPDFNDMDDLKNKKVVVTKGFYLQGLLKKYYPDIKQILVRSQTKALRLLSLGKVDAVIGKKVVIDYIIIEKNISNILATNYINDKRMSSDIRLGVAKQDKILRDILQKAQDSVSDEELMKLKQKWFAVKINNSIRKIILTKKEKNFLSKKRVLEVCTNPNWAPIEFTENGKPQGISIDIIKIIAKKLSLKIKFIKTKTWKESQEYLRDKKCDILPAAIKTKQREKYAVFTNPYLIYGLAIVTKKDKPFVNNLKSIIDKKMSRKSNTGLIAQLKSKFPDIKIVETRGYKEALEDVEQGKVYFTISTFPILSYYKKKYNFENLQIAGYTKMKYKLRIVVKKDEKTLLNILNKALLTIPKDTKNIINEKWTTVHVVRQNDYVLVWKLSFVFFLIFLIFLHLYSKQRKLKNKLEKLNYTLEERIKKEVEKSRIQDQKLFQQSRLAQMGEMISMIAHQWRQPLAAISATTSNLKFKIMLDELDVHFLEKEIDLIDKYSQHLSKTIDDFRGFFKENKYKESVSLEEMLENTLNIVEKSLKNKNIKIKKLFGCNKKFEVYQNEIIQVILNLIKNAEDALMEKKIKNPVITLKTLCKENIGAIMVQDNAGGVPEEILDKIFDPYFSTKMEKDGTGLGLYMSKTIVEQHCEGKMCVRNDKDGAIFTIELNSQIKRIGTVNEK